MLLEKWCWQTCWTRRPATSLQFVNNCKQSVRCNKKRSAGIETDLIKGPSSLGKSVENRNKFPACVHCYQECFTIQKCWLFNSISFPACHHEFPCGSWKALYTEATILMVMTQTACDFAMAMHYSKQVGSTGAFPTLVLSWKGQSLKGLYSERTGRGGKQSL